MNGLFTRVFIYSVEITLLAPLRASLDLMLEQCESFSRIHDILSNVSKTKYMIFKHSEIVNVTPLYFKDSPIHFVQECDNITTDNVITIKSHSCTKCIGESLKYNGVTFTISLCLKIIYFVFETLDKMPCTTVMRLK